MIMESEDGRQEIVDHSKERMLLLIMKENNILIFILFTFILNC